MTQRSSIKDINLNENGIYVVKDGMIFKVEAPRSGYGETSCTWIHGKIDRVETKNVEKI